MNYNEYHPDWKDVIRPAILKRDNYACRHCGIRHKTRVYKDSKKRYVECDDFIYNWAVANGKKPFVLFLQVAHVDHNKENNEPNNLLSLCPRCHGLFDKAYKQLLKRTYNSRISEQKRKEKIKYNTKEAQLIHAVITHIHEMTDFQMSMSQSKELIDLITSNVAKDDVGRT